MESVLSIRNLNVSFDTYNSTVYAVRGVSLEVRKGEILALVGESGCGKTVTAQSILRLNDSPSVRIKADCLRLGEVDVLRASEKEMDAVRRNLVGMVFQDPLTSLNPTMKVGRQITEHRSRKERMTRTEENAEAVRLLNMVCIPDAKLRAGQYPHQFSGGMRQRIMIAMALASNPGLLIADEPTTALDVTIQLEILKLIHQIRCETGTAMLLITHDFGVVANIADRVAVMYAGKIVEEGDMEELFLKPAHPYTEGLIKSMPLPQGRGKLHSIKGTLPDVTKVQKGCSFAERCSYCMQICLREEPPSVMVGKGHTASCWKLYKDGPEGVSI